MHCGITAQLLFDTLEADLCSVSCLSYVLLLGDLLQKCTKTLRDAFRIIIDVSQISAWHSRNPAREIWSSAWHHVRLAHGPLTCWFFHRGSWEKISSSEVSNLCCIALFFYPRLEGDAGASQPVLLSSFQWCWHQSTGSRSSSIPGWRIVAAAI